MRRFWLAVLVMGFILNLAGWLGNVFLLGPMWAAVPEPPMASPFSPLLHEALTFVSDFVFAFVLCAVYCLARGGWRGSKLTLAVYCSALIWLCGVPMTYLALVNGGYLPAGVSIATTILALAGFIITSPLLPWLLPEKSGS